MAFEKFQKHGESFTPRVSIWTNGTLGVSAGAFNLYELTGKNYVTLYFDRANNRVGMLFSGHPEPGAVRMTSRKSGGIIPCKSLFENYSISYSVVRNYVLSWSETEGMFVFDLDLPIEDNDCPEYPHAMFVERVYSGLATFLADRQDLRLTVKTCALLSRNLFSIAAHHHLDQDAIRELLVAAVNPSKGEADKRVLRLNKILSVD